MGYSITPIAVDLGQVSGVIGSKNKQLVSDLAKKYGAEFEMFDEDLELTMQDALTQMVMGERYDEELGFLYGYALKFICRHLGYYLPNQWWSAMPSGSAYVEEADKALKEVGVSEEVLTVGGLIYSGSPVRLPIVYDFPRIGYMRAKEIDSALNVFAEDTLATVKDDGIRSSLSELWGWLLACTEEKLDLVCFYH
jgi:hypothetical protein